MTMRGWVGDALCVEVGPEMFYIEDDVDQSRLRYSGAAQKLCGSCPVRPQCLDEAMAVEYGTGLGRRYGIWGGLTPIARVRLARQRGERVAGRGFDGAIE